MAEDKGACESDREAIRSLLTDWVELQWAIIGEFSGSIHSERMAFVAEAVVPRCERFGFEVAEVLTESIAWQLAEYRVWQEEDRG